MSKLNKQPACNTDIDFRLGTGSIERSSGHHIWKNKTTHTHSPLSHSSDSDISAIFELVMSLCDARNSTTSRFSFLIGTMSSRHQNGVPAKWCVYKKQWTKQKRKRKNRTKNSIKNHLMPTKPKMEFQ
jgi:hypothetical protein